MIRLNWDQVKDHFALSLSLSLSLSILTAIFPGEPGLAGVHWSKRWWKWSYKSCKAPVEPSPPTNQHPTFTGRMPFLLPNQQCWSTEAKKSHSMDLLTPLMPVPQRTAWLLFNNTFNTDGNKETTVQYITSEWVAFNAPNQHIHFGDETFQSITYTGPLHRSITSFGIRARVPKNIQDQNLS